MPIITSSEGSTLDENIILVLEYVFFNLFYACACHISYTKKMDSNL